MRAKRAKVSERSELRCGLSRRIWWHTYKRIWWHTYKRIWCFGEQGPDTCISAFGVWHTYKRGPWAIVFDCFAWILWGKNGVPLSDRRSFARDYKKTGWFFWLSHLWKKSTRIVSLWKLRCRQSSSVIFESDSTYCVDSRINKCFLSWILDWPYVKLCTTVKK